MISSQTYHKKSASDSTMFQALKQHKCTIPFIGFIGSLSVENTKLNPIVL